MMLLVEGEMVNRRSLFLAVLMGLVLSGMARADMMPIDRSDIASPLHLQTHPAASSRPTTVLAHHGCINLTFVVIKKK